MRLRIARCIQRCVLESPNGLSHFDGQTWTSYIPADGLTNMRLSSVVVTDAGAVWVGAGGDGVGGGGLSRYTP